MKTIKNFLYDNRYFFLIILLFYLYGLFRLLSYSKIDNHLFFNRMVGNVVIDTFFKYLTTFGDGLFLIIIVVLWVFKNVRQSLILLFSYAIAGGLVAILKNYVFDEARPHYVFDYFHKDTIVKYVQGVDLLALNSFPSGHSTTAFVLFSFMAFVFKNHAAKISFAVLAILVAFSRVYLSQHWFNDILAGSFIGLFFTCGIWILFTATHYFSKLDRAAI